MPDTRSHRGPHPEDADLFAPANWPRLQAAVDDYSWLRGREYAEPSAIKTVGDRYELNARQRMAVVRSSCSDEAMRGRFASQIAPDAMAGQPLCIDGFNVLTTIEVALGGGVVLAARDGCYRDIASVHGTYRHVEETEPAIEIIGQVLTDLAPASCHWYFDSPVGNSGRLKLLIENLAQERGWNWNVQVAPNPDAILIASSSIVATADSMILDRCRRWLNLACEIISKKIPQTNLVPMVQPMGNRATGV